MPDLVLVYMDDGQEGYVYSVDLTDRVAANPEEAVEIMREQAARSRSGAGPIQIVAVDAEWNPIGTLTLAK